MPALRVVLIVALGLPAIAAAQIRRCESPDKLITYSNAECPAGTRAVKSLAVPPQPSPEERKAAAERARREKDVGQTISAKRQAGATGAQGYVSVEEARRAADCAYLQAELDASRRLRNVLTTRPYYSSDDVDQMDARTAQLAGEYARVCSR
jgi:hypothetical protein